MTDLPLAHVPGIWREGMLTTEGYRLIHRIDFSLITPEAIGHWLFAADGKCWHDTLDGHEVELDDHSGATTGCLAAFCRGLWKLPDLYCRPLLPGGWVVQRPFTRPDLVFDDVHGPTEAAAWRNAILVHPSLSELR